MNPTGFVKPPDKAFPAEVPKTRQGGAIARAAPYKEGMGVVNGLLLIALHYNRSHTVGGQLACQCRCTGSRRILNQRMYRC